MTGTFFLAYAASSFISAVIAQRTGQTLGGNLLSQAVAMQKYISVYTRLGVFALAVAILLALLSPLLTRRMHITS